MRAANRLRAGPVVAVVAVFAVVVATGLALAVTGGEDSPTTGSDDVPTDSDTTAAAVAGDFLETYVDPDGRVVRRDQGGDTVSEGQAYALLLAVGVGDRDTFDRVWGWTDEALRRPDGLLSWRWADGAVVDESSASDADLDVARALVLAGERWSEPAYTDAGVDLGGALLDHETVATSEGLVLAAGQWATEPPYDFNPSYVSPVATTLLAEASGDPRWKELEAGSRAAVDRLSGDGLLPPDWAEVGEDGSTRPVPGPSGQPVQFGYDAARTIVRHAESCEEQDRTIAAEAASVLGEDDAPAVLDVAGSPQTENASPLMLVAQAAARAADGDDDGADDALAAAERARLDVPTYYGDAWTALGRLLLTDDSLGGCPVVEAER